MAGTPINNLNIASWNVAGVMSGASYLSDILDKRNLDICGISEHWRFEHDLQFLDSINNKYSSYSVADPDLMIPSHRRVGKGGIGILWHRRLKAYSDA